MSKRLEYFLKCGFARNPFPKQTLTDAWMRRLVFTGRLAELERVLDSANTGEPCCLSGTYGIGKTLLMQEAQRILSEEHSGLLPAYTRFLPEKGFNDTVFDAISLELRNRKIADAVVLETGKPLSSIRVLLDEAKMNNLRLFVLVDDMDRTRDLQDIKSIIDSIRELRDLGCAVCVPANPNNVTHNFGTAAQHILDPIEVGRLNRDEYLEMAARYINAERQKAVTCAAAHLSRPRVFLSYAREDQPQVRRLYELLKNLGFDPWMDTKSLFPGEQFEVAIELAIQESEFVVFCISEGSRTKRGFLRDEMHLALKLARKYLPDDIYIIPVKLENCQLPAELDGYHSLDLAHRDAIP